MQPTRVIKCKGVIKNKTLWRTSLLDNRLLRGYLTLDKEAFETTSAPLQERRLEQGLCHSYSILWARQQEVERQRLIADFVCKAYQMETSKVFLLRRTVQKCFPPQPEQGRRKVFKTAVLLHMGLTFQLLPREAVLSPTLAVPPRPAWIKPRVTLPQPGGQIRDLLSSIPAWIIQRFWVPLDYHCAQAQIQNSPLRLSLVLSFQKKLKKNMFKLFVYKCEQFVMKVCSMQNCAVTMATSIERDICCKSIRISFWRDLVVLVTDLWIFQSCKKHPSFLQNCF